MAALAAANPPALSGAPVGVGSYTVLATYAGSQNYATAGAVADFSITKAAPTVSVTDAGGTYSTLAFPATNATVAGVGSDGTIASFGSSSLSYAYYSGTFSTAAALAAANPPALGGARWAWAAIRCSPPTPAVRITRRLARWPTSRSARPRPR